MVLRNIKIISGTGIFLPRHVFLRIAKKHIIPEYILDYSQNVTIKDKINYPNIELQKQGVLLLSSFSMTDCCTSRYYDEVSGPISQSDINTFPSQANLIISDDYDNQYKYLNNIRNMLKKNNIDIDKKYSSLFDGKFNLRAYAYNANNLSEYEKWLFNNCIAHRPIRESIGTYVCVN